MWTIFSPASRVVLASRATFARLVALLLIMKRDIVTR